MLVYVYECMRVSMRVCTCECIYVWEYVVSMCMRGCEC